MFTQTTQFEFCHACHSFTLHDVGQLFSALHRVRLRGVGGRLRGAKPSFWVLQACRVVMGAGEASIITLTGPFVDDVAAPAQKTL